MTEKGWRRLFADVPRQWKPGEFPIAAYSEFMPPPRIGWKPYGGRELSPFTEDDPFGWQVTEYQERVELLLGLPQVARQILGALINLAQGRGGHTIAHSLLEGNPYWTAELAENAGKLEHEPYLFLSPLALSRTQDDKGRVRWTLFGGSEQGPEWGFWRSFYTEPGREQPTERSIEFISRLLGAVYGESPEMLGDLHRAGFRILPTEKSEAMPYSYVNPLPTWTAAYRWAADDSFVGVKYLLTFRPFRDLPEEVRHAYLAGNLHLLPYPGSMIFWGAQPFLRLQGQLPMAMQISLLHLCERHESPQGLRVPQSGWLHEHHPDQPQPDPRFGAIRNTYHRTHRWARLHRNEDELAVLGNEDRLAHVLFSAKPEDIGLYGKPMARNAQIWTRDYRLLLDGPQATRNELEQAAEALRNGGHFGYRFLFPAMRVGMHEAYWQRPLVAYRSLKTKEVEVLPDAPLGCLTAYPAEKPCLDRPLELWPRALDRPAYRQAALDFVRSDEHHNHLRAIDLRKILNAWQLRGGQPLPRSFARHLLIHSKEKTLETWLQEIADWNGNAGGGIAVAESIEKLLEPPEGTSGASYPSPEPLTYFHTHTREFEAAYWKMIANLAEGKYCNKDNADCVDDPVSAAMRSSPQRDLEALSDFLLDYYRHQIQLAKSEGKSLAGDLPFTWRTDFDFGWSGGWRNNQEGKTEERNLLVVIPGRDRSRAVIMADHYDTAYMEDRYEKARGGNGARLAAAGADDNHSATAALMLGFPLFLQLSRAGKLECDIWLVHLTGEEFPSDCMGARHLAQWLVEHSLQLRMSDRSLVDLKEVQVQGVYVLDMIAHNRDHDRDVFQISPGASRESLWLAYQAHLANMLWNAQASEWNRNPERRHCQHGRRSLDGKSMPEIALHSSLHGEIRTPDDPRSSLYNTDGQIFSDAGVPVVLFMENYDINRVGYHDTHDTMANIDLDYGAAMAAIAIESVARTAAESLKK